MTQMMEKQEGVCESVKENRNYKDTIFRMLFGEKEALLSLFNAVNGTNYTNPEELVINTLENAIYMNVKNDVSCVLDMQLNLYEHQSTVNPNMPLRDLIYVTRLYEAMFKEDELYNSERVTIPTPKFIVFYNGSRKQPERSTLYLSDLYAKKEGKENLELRVLQLNISKGFNEDLKKKCPILMGYMQYVEKVRLYTGMMPLREAVERSITECIEEDILVSFFRRNRAEAIHMSITQYNQEAHMARIAETNRKRGLKEGCEIGRESINQLFQKLLEDERIEDLRRSVTDSDFQMQLLKEYGLWNDE